MATEQHGHPDFHKILEELADLHSRKNHDYATQKDPLSNLCRCRRVGLEPWVGVVIRLEDKMGRIEGFVRKRNLEVKDESIEDTLKDMAVYSILCLVLYRKEREASYEAECLQTMKKPKPDATALPLLQSLLSFVSYLGKGQRVNSKIAEEARAYEASIEAVIEQHFDGVVPTVCSDCKKKAPRLEKYITRKGEHKWLCNDCFSDAGYRDE